MNRAFGKVFKSENGVKYGVIRKATAPFPKVLSALEVLAEDGCGNYFVLLDEAEVLSNSIDDFVSRCSALEEVELEPGQVESAWIDPEFAKKFGIKSKPL